MLGKMAGTGTHWETVRKPSKKAKTADQNGLTKAQKKSFIDNMPRIETSPPVKESATIYDAFLEKERQEAQRDSDIKQPVVRPSGNGAVHKKGAHAAQGHKGSKAGADKRDQRPQGLEEAAKNIEVKELESVLERAQATFPENASVWLKDLASILNLKLDKIPEPDPVFHGKPNDFPLCLLGNPIRKMLLKVVGQCSTLTLEYFLEHCVISMVSDMSKGISTYGYRMFIQLLMHEKPDLNMSNLHKYEEMIKLNQNRPLRCLSILWAVGQTGVPKVQNGVKVWLEFMFPMLSVRALSAYCVEYLENLFKMHQDLKPAMNSLRVKDFFRVVDVVFTPQPSLPSALQKRLQAMYPTLQTVAFGADPENRLHQMFPMFLNRCTGENKLLHAQVLPSLVQCLSVDKASFSEWRQMYTKTNLHKSGLLLQHLCQNWNKVNKVLDQKVLRDTINSFNITNEDMSVKGSQRPEGFDVCASSCKELLAKMSRTRFPWRWVLVLLLGVFAGIVAYDVYTSKGIKHSRGHKLLNDAGILVFLEQVWKRFAVFSNKVLDWLQENVPFYYGKVCEFVGPYLQLFWEKLYELAVYIVQVSKPARDWLSEKIPQLLEWIRINFPRDTLDHYLQVTWTFIVTYSCWIWEHIVTCTNCATTWLLENVFTGNLSPENILSTLSSLLAALQSYIMAAIQWVSGLFLDSPTPGADKQQ